MDGIKKLQLATLLGIKNGNYGSIIQSQEMFQFLNRFYDVQYALLADRNDIINSDVILWGGDQVFNENLFRDLFINIHKSTRHIKNIIFSASFGKQKLGQNIKQFLNFCKSKQNIICATREINEYVKQLFKEKHFTVIDPALIKSKNDWILTLADTNEHKENYIFGYAPCNSANECKIYNDLGKKLGIDTNIVKNNMITINNFDISYVNSFLRLLKNSKVVYTNSFHCFLFAVLFNKQIKFYYNDFKTNLRISSFIKKYGIEFDIEGNIQNYPDIIKKIDEDRHKSLLYLYDSIFYRIEAYAASTTLNTNICSAGGISMVLAYEVISHGGCVYGVAWKNVWETEYICIDQIDDYYKIAGSKYIQALPPDFNEIKQKLDAGKYVMLVGTPCLIRAFQQYIFFKEYLNLLLVDLLCSGIFSVEKHKEIVDEALALHDWNQSDVVDIKHRWKDGAVYGGNINVFHKNGQVIKIFENGELFEKAKFENSLKMCFECPCGTHRQVKNVHYSDITIGDAWGIPENKNSSLSKVIINSKHGLKFFDKIKYMIQFKKLPIEHVISAY